MMKTARGKKIAKIITTLFFIAALCGLIRSVDQMTVYSKYIDEPATMLPHSDKQNYVSFSMSSTSTDHFDIHFGLLGGKNKLGDMAVSSNAAITADTKSLIGRAKLLIVDESTEKTAFYQDISDNTSIPLSTGNYHVYLVGSWFSGKCNMDFSNAAFHTKS